MPEKSVKSVSRRDFLKFTGLLASVAAVTTGCGPDIIDSLAAPEIPQEPALAKMTIGEGVNFQVFSAVTAVGVEFLANIADNGYVPYDVYPAGVLTSSCQQKSTRSLLFGTETGDLAELGTSIWLSEDRRELTNQIFANQDLDILGAWFDNGEITGTPGMVAVVRGKVPHLVKGKLDFEGQSTEEGLAIVFFNHEDDLSQVSFSAADGADNHVANILTIMAQRQAVNTPFTSDAHLLDAVVVPSNLKEEYEALIQTAGSPEAVIRKLQQACSGLAQEKIPVLIDHPAVIGPRKMVLPIGQKLQLYRIISFNNQAYAAVTINNNEGNQTLVYLPINAVQVQRRPEEFEDKTYDAVATEIQGQIDGFSIMTQVGQQTAAAATETAQYTPRVTFTPKPTVTLPPVYSATPTGTGGPGSVPEQVNPGAYIPLETAMPMFGFCAACGLAGFAWMISASQVKK